MAGGVANDFNNILSVIIGNAEIALANQGLPDEIAKSLAGIQEAAERSASITRQLLAFARRQVISPKLLDLNASVDEMLKMLRRLIGEDIEEIDLLVTDVVMPGMNGRELSQLLTPERSSMKTLYLSGYTSDIIVKRGVLQEGVHLLQKPFSRDDLGKKIKDLLSG